VVCAPARPPGYGACLRVGARPQAGYGASRESETEPEKVSCPPGATVHAHMHIRVRARLPGRLRCEPETEQEEVSCCMWEFGSTDDRTEPLPPHLALRTLALNLARSPAPASPPSRPCPLPCHVARCHAGLISTTPPCDCSRQVASLCARLDLHHAIGKVSTASSARTTSRSPPTYFQSCNRDFTPARKSWHRS
jgi:hypothetical protein